MVLTTGEAVRYTANAYYREDIKQAMIEIIAIAPPIINIKIPGLDEYLASNPSKRELMHLAMFSATEPVYSGAMDLTQMLY